MAALCVQLQCTAIALRPTLPNLHLALRTDCHYATIQLQIDSAFLSELIILTLAGIWAWDLPGSKTPS